MSLLEDDAAALIAKLDPAQIEAVSIEIAKLNSVSGDEQENVIREFAEANPHQLGERAGGLDLAKNLLQGTGLESARLGQTELEHLFDDQPSAQPASEYTAPAEESPVEQPDLTEYPAERDPDHRPVR